MISKLASNYSSLPVTIAKGKDIFLWDTSGKKYVDLLAGYSAVNQGHCHPRIVKALIKQSERVTLTSRVVYSNTLLKWADYITDKFKYESVLAMNSGAEAVETAVKLARKYGYITKRPNIACLTGNFHGRTLGTVSLSDYPPYKTGFGPFIKNTIYIEMNNVVSLRNAFQKYGSTISAFLYEPVQGEGGVIPMTEDFIETMRSLKKENPDILFMSDEIQSGLGRTGHLTTSSDYFKFKPDVLILGKALSGGILPMSCILSSKDIMGVFSPGTHGSTFGGNPLACAVSMEAIDVIEQECLPNVKRNALAFDKLLKTLSPYHITDIRGIGMFWGVQFDNKYSIENLRERMLQAGYITCTSRNNTLRITPPLTITYTGLKDAIAELERQL